MLVTGEGGARIAIADGVSGIYLNDPDPAFIGDAVMPAFDVGGRTAERQAKRLANDRFGLKCMIARTRAVYRL
jgi:hypothetical protein